LEDFRIQGSKRISPYLNPEFDVSSWSSINSSLDFLSLILLGFILVQLICGFIVLRLGRSFLFRFLLGKVLSPFSVNNFGEIVKLLLKVVCSLDGNFEARCGVGSNLDKLHIAPLSQDIHHSGQVGHACGLIAEQLKILMLVLVQKGLDHFHVHANIKSSSNRENIAQILLSLGARSRLANRSILSGESFFRLLSSVLLC